MPCSDVTEIIRVELDADDRLKDYSLTKRSCGVGVGPERHLHEKLRGMPAQDIRGFAGETFLENHPVSSELERFLSLKHLFAIQAALGVLTGEESGRPGDPCAAASISCDENCTVIEARIRVDIIAERIPPCDPCAGCPAELCGLASLQ